MTQNGTASESKARLVRSLWLVAGAVAVHELEEWNIASWTARNFTNHTGISDHAIWIGLVFITAVFITWIYVATRLENPLAISVVALPAVALVRRAMPCSTSPGLFCSPGTTPASFPPSFWSSPLRSMRCGG